MSNIQNYLTQILSAVYGREVRQSIHDAIEQCYDDVNNPTLNTEALNDAIQKKIDSGELAGMTLGDKSVTNAKLADDSVDTSNVKDGAITMRKLGSDVDLELKDNAVTVEKLSGTTHEYAGGLNQIDYDNCVTGYKLDNTTGGLVENSSYCVSNKMPVNDNTHYYARISDWDGNTYIMFYDSSDALVSSVKIGQANNGVYGEIPTGAVYAKACFRGIDKKPYIIFASEAISSDSTSSATDILMRYINKPFGDIKTNGIQPYFDDESISISALKGAGAKMYNMFSNVPNPDCGLILLPLRKKYYIYNMSDEKIANGSYKLWALKKNRGEVTIANQFIYAGTCAEFTIDDALYNNAVLVALDKKTLTEAQISGLMISERNDLKEYHAYGEMYFEPDSEMKKLVQSAKEDVVKQYGSGVMMTLGDSYTAQMNTLYNSFAKKHGLVQDNRGVVSSTIAGDESGNIGYRPFWSRLNTAITEYKAGLTIDNVTYSADDVKLIVFMGGANDWSTVNETADRIGKGAFETDKGKLYGALNYIFATLLSTFKNADIVTILQPVNFNTSVPTDEKSALSVGFESLEQAQAMTTEQYSTYLMTRKEKIVREMAQMYGLQICDCCFEWYNPNNPVDAETYWRTDHLHLSNAGYEAVIEKLEGVVNNLPVKRN